MHGRRGLELRRRHHLSAIACLLLLAACGTPTAEHEAQAPARSAGGEVMPATVTQAPATQAIEGQGVAPVLSGVVGAAPLEPQLLTPVVLVPRPAEPSRVRLALSSLRPGQTFRPPAGACQDVLLYVREGELRAVGSGIAPPEAPATLYAGDAVRFGPEADGLVQNLGERTARTVVAFVRAEGEPSFDDAGEGCASSERADPLVRAIRSASVWSTPAYDAYDGALRIRILLDEGAGAHDASLSVLEGDPELTMPEHRHEGAAEILLVEEGAGIMRIGERELAVRAGMALYVPPGVLHDFRGDGTRPLRAIQLHTPAGPEQRMRR